MHVCGLKHIARSDSARGAIKIGLKMRQIDALYIAVPHDLHETVYVDAIQSGKALLGEKPFGIDKAANARINEALAVSDALVRYNSESPFFPGAQRIVGMVQAGGDNEV